MTWKAWLRLSARHIKRLGWLEGETRIVLEIDAGTEFPGQFVDSVNLEDVGRIEVEVVVIPVDVVIGISEIVTESLVGIASPVHAFLPLDGKASQDLPFVRESLDRSEFEPVIGVVIELGNVGDDEIECTVFGWIGGLKTEQSQRLVCNGVHDRLAANRRDRHVI